MGGCRGRGKFVCVYIRMRVGFDISETSVFVAMACLPAHV